MQVSIRSFKKMSLRRKMCTLIRYEQSGGFRKTNTQHIHMSKKRRDKNK